MKLLTQEILDRLPSIASQDDVPESEAIAQVKYFTPWAEWKWYATAYDPDSGIFFGVVVGDETEWGAFALEELESVTGPLNLHIERDKFFKPTKISVLFPEGV